MITRILARRFALMGAMAVLGAVTFAPKVSAQVSQPVPFNGTVPGACTFGPTVIPGTLELSDPHTLITQMPGSVTLSCTVPATTMQVEEPTLTAGPTGIADANFMWRQSSVELLNNGVSTFADSQSSFPVFIEGPIPFTDQPVTVMMQAQSDTPLPGGTYTFEVNITVTSD